jgi:DNA-binding transcriptional regulator YiaG
MPVWARSKNISDSLLRAVAAQIVAGNVEADLGAMDEITMCKVEALCLPKKQSFNSEDVRRIRIANHVSQAVFAVR